MSEAKNSSECQNAFTLGQTSLQQTRGLPFVVIPDNGRVHTFEDTLERPLHLEQAVKLDTAKDFIKYVERFADKNSIIFVNVLSGRFKAVLDYHEVKDKSDDGVVAAPRHAKHVANLTVEKTTEFKKIEASSGEKFTQTQFALFLEDVMPYINQPAAAELYEIVQTLNAKTNVDFKSGIRTDNGQVQLQYNETIEARAGVSGNLTIPEQIVFGIQVHRGGEHYALPARFRYRIKDGNITFWYDLDQLEKAIEKSMEDTVDYIRSGKIVVNQEEQAVLPGVPEYVTILEGSI